MKLLTISLLGALFFVSCSTSQFRNIASAKSHCSEAGYNIEDIEGRGDMVSIEEADAAIVLASKYGTLPILKENTVLSFAIILKQSGVTKADKVLARVNKASHMSESFLDIITAFECHQE